MFACIAGCTSSAPVNVGSQDERICTLDESGTSFKCTVSYKLTDTGGAKCAAQTPVEVKHDFVIRMTGISLDMLYLDTEPGARGPYQYNDIQTVIMRIQDAGCHVAGGNCLCDLSYFDPGLKEIFYDSAGCRSGSSYSNHPLYFRGNGCR